MRITGFNIMAENEIADYKVVFEGFNTGFFVPVITKYIMVPFYQVNVYPRKVISPFEKKFVLFIVGAVKEIANDQEPGWLKILQLGNEPVHVFFENGLGNRYACFPEVPGLAKVQVG